MKQGDWNAYSCALSASMSQLFQGIIPLNLFRGLSSIAYLILLKFIFDIIDYNHNIVYMWNWDIQMF